jgi:hypothetical protein
MPVLSDVHRGNPDGQVVRTMATGVEEYCDNRM